MNIQKAEYFVRENARPVELAEFRCHFEGGPKEALVQAMKPYQNPDGGFGNALEADNWNPCSSPITTNDALIRLFETGALKEAGEMAQGIKRYLLSGDGFDAGQQRWRFALDSNKDYPHAVWWERKGDCPEGWNPTVSLAAFLVCMGEGEPYRALVREAFAELAQAVDSPGGDQVKCYILACELLEAYGISGVVDFDSARQSIQKAIAGAVCQEASKYGREYVTTPSEFFVRDSPFLPSGLEPLIQAELEALDRLQLEDGGFDITWQWYTPYPEFQQARAWWRPRVTMEKLRFCRWCANR